MRKERQHLADNPAKARPALMLVAVCLLLAGCDGGADLEVPDGALELPDDHLAAQLLADDAPPEEVSSAAVMCEQGGTVAGPQSTCLIDDDGQLVLLPLSMPSGVQAVITGSAFDREFEVPLPAVSGRSLPTARELFAIPHDVGDMNIELYYNREPAGAEFSGPLGQ